MDPLLLAGIIGAITLLFLFSGMPIAFGLGVPALGFILLFMDQNQFDLIAHIVFDGINDFGLLAIPLFILMGTIIGATRAGADLYEGLHRWLHRLPGGLAISNLVSCAIFAALCGSSPATAAAIGTMGIPEMRKRGYPETLATGCIVAGGTLGILIPPSVTMIVYGIATKTSVGKLFIAGVIPGIVITMIMCLWVIIYAYWARGRFFSNKSSRPLLKEGLEFYSPVSYTWRERFSSIFRVVPFLMIIFLIMGTLYGGWATPSEAAAVGSVSTLILVMIIYRLSSWHDYAKILRWTVKENTMIMLIIAVSFLFGAVLTKLYITQAITQYIISLGYSKWWLMLLINIFLLILGCFLPPVAIILIINPILHPVIINYGFDPVWFGVIVTINMEIGLITPPVGLNLYIVQGIAPDVPLSKVLIGSAPFVVILLLGIILLCFFPQLALWLPNKMITR
ncbi:MAG: TRAP transporter large permease [Thermodesulfobacteriota bacterium]